MRGRCQTQHVSTQAPTERAAGVGPGARQLQTQTRGRQGSAARARAGGRMRRRAGRRSRRLRRACWRCRAQTASRRASWRRRSSRRASRWPPWSASAGSRALSRSCSLVRARAQLAHPLPMAGASCRPAPRGRTVAGQGRAGPARTWQSLLPRPGQPHPSKARPGCAQRGSKVEAFFWVWGFPLALCARMRMRGGRRPWPRPRTRADPNRLVYPNVTPRQAGCWRAEAPTLRRRCSGTCGASTRAPPP